MEVNPKFKAISNITAQELNTNKRFRPRLLPKQKKFLVEYLKCGVIWKAYRKVYNCKDESAQVLGYSLIKKLEGHLAMLYEKRGLTNNMVANILKKAAKANRQVVAGREIYEYPDHFTRLQVAKIVSDTLNGKQAGTGGQANQQMNVFIVEDTGKNRFEVTDGT